MKDLLSQPDDLFKSVIFSTLDRDSILNFRKTNKRGLHLANLGLFSAETEWDKRWEYIYKQLNAPSNTIDASILNFAITNSTLSTLQRLTCLVFVKLKLNNSIKVNTETLLSLIKLRGDEPTNTLISHLVPLFLKFLPPNDFQNLLDIIENSIERNDKVEFNNIEWVMAFIIPHLDPSKLLLLFNKLIASLKNSLQAIKHNYNYDDYYSNAWRLLAMMPPSFIKQQHKILHPSLINDALKYGNVDTWYSVNKILQNIDPKIRQKNQILEIINNYPRTHYLYAFKIYITLSSLLHTKDIDKWLPRLVTAGYISDSTPALRQHACELLQALLPKLNPQQTERLLKMSLDTILFYDFDNLKHQLSLIQILIPLLDPTQLYDFMLHYISHAHDYSYHLIMRDKNILLFDFKILLSAFHNIKNEIEKPQITKLIDVTLQQITYSDTFTDNIALQIFNECLAQLNSTQLLQVKAYLEKIVSSDNQSTSYEAATVDAAAGLLGYLLLNDQYKYPSAQNSKELKRTGLCLFNTFIHENKGEETLANPVTNKSDSTPKKLLA